jgi:hypothetical protein
VSPRRGGLRLRLLRAVAFGLAVLWIAAPVLAANTGYRGECKRMTRQMARYERDAKWAQQRGDAMWRDASKDRVKQLSDRRDELCPHLKKKNPLAQVADLVAAAAKAAAPYFIPGL